MLYIQICPDEVLTFGPSGTKSLVEKVLKCPDKVINWSHSLFSVTTPGNFDFPGKVTSRENRLSGKFDFPGK